MDSARARGAHVPGPVPVGPRTVRVDTHVCPTRYAAARVAVAVQRRAAPPPRHPPSTCRFAPRARQEVAHQQMHEHGHGSCQQAAAAAASSAVCANEMSEQWCESRGSEPTSIGHNRTQQDTTQERMAERHEQSAQIPTAQLTGHVWPQMDLATSSASLRRLPRLRRSPLRTIRSISMIGSFLDGSIATATAAPPPTSILRWR